MGVMRFLLPQAAREAGASELRRAYLGGMDGRVFASEIDVKGGLLVCRRETSESARLHVGYPVAGHGRPVLNTASLRERDEPYLLSVELARGRLGALRDQLAAWNLAGMAVPQDVESTLREAQAAFADAACSQGEPADATDAADTALAACCTAAERLTDAYVRQRLSARRRRSSHLPVLLGCPLGLARPNGGAWGRPFISAFTASTVNVEWRNVELRQGEYEWTLADEQVAFAEANRLVPSAGPLLDFAADGLPEWLWQWEHDYYGLQCFVSDFVETAVMRYAGRIRFWEIAARANTGGGCSLNEEHRLALTARAVEVARQADDELQLSLRVDRPWGEYLAAGTHRLSPLQFVDALVRSGVGLSGVTLEIALGYRPGSDYRDRFEVSRLIDLWSTLGLPLTVALAFPSRGKPDPAAVDRIEVAAPQWTSPWGEPAQAEWLSQIVPVLMAKAPVVGIEWAHFDDRLPHRYPHAGLISSDGSAKPSLERLTRLRQSYWQRDRDAG